MRQLIFRKNYYSGLRTMEPADRLRAYDAIMAYAFDEELPEEVPPTVAPTLMVIFESIDIDFAKFERNGKARGWQ